MNLETRTLVQVEYQMKPGPASGPKLTHKRILVLATWPESATDQLRTVREVVASHEGTGVDKVAIATINTIGPGFVEVE